MKKFRLIQLFFIVSCFSLMANEQTNADNNSSDNKETSKEVDTIHDGIVTIDESQTFLNIPSNKKYSKEDLLSLMNYISTVNSILEEPAKEEENAIGEFFVNGSLDLYYHKSLNTDEIAPRTSFSNLNGFSLGMVNIATGYISKKSGFLADLTYGPRGDEAAFNSSMYKNASGSSSSNLINQMSIYYNLTDKIRLNVGKFNTFLGCEIISPTQNFHYSTSYLFSFGPFSHNGLRADFDLGNGFISKLAIMNPTDFVEFNPFNTYVYGGQIGYAKPDNGYIFLSAIYGDNDGKLEKNNSLLSSTGNSLQTDLNASINLSSNYQVGLNASLRSIEAGELRDSLGIIFKNNNDANGFYGLALYQKYVVNNYVSIGLRAEYFNEFNYGVGALGTYTDDGRNNVMEFTLSGNIVKDNFRLIPELRFDKTMEKVFHKNTVSTSQMISANIAFVYTLPAINNKVYR